MSGTCPNEVFITYPLADGPQTGPLGDNMWSCCLACRCPLWAKTDTFYVGYVNTYRFGCSSNLVVHWAIASLFWCPCEWVHAAHDIYQSDAVFALWFLASHAAPPWWRILVWRLKYRHNASWVASFTCSGKLSCQCFRIEFNFIEVGGSIWKEFHMMCLFACL